MNRLQTIDRRIIYLVLVLSIVIFILKPIQIPVIPSPQSVDFYNTVVNTPKNKLVIIGADWSASSKGENDPQTVAVINHLMMLHLKFAILGFDPQGPTLVERIANRLAPRYHYVYGVNWIDWGFRPPSAMIPLFKAMVQNIPVAIQHDAQGTRLTNLQKLPIMRGINSIQNVGLLIEITPSNTTDAWIAFLQSVNNTPMLLCPTSVMAPEAYQYLDSGQLSGMLTGLRGAIEYETLIHRPGYGLKVSPALSATHVLIILLIILGNAGYLLEKRSRRLTRTRE